MTRFCVEIETAHMKNLLKLTYQERKRNDDAGKRKWRENNKDKVRAYGRRNAALYRERHPDIVKERKLRDYQKNRQTYIERARQWRLANPEKHRQHMLKAKAKLKAVAHAPRCMGCESLLKNTTSTHCEWCLQTYHVTYA